MAFMEDGLVWGIFLLLLDFITSFDRINPF